MVNTIIIIITSQSYSLDHDKYIPATLSRKDATKDGAWNSSIESCAKNQ